MGDKSLETISLEVKEALKKVYDTILYTDKNMGKEDYNSLSKIRSIKIAYDGRHFKH